MNYSCRRKLFMGIGLLALAVWAGITYWPPTASLAADGGAAEESEGTYADLTLEDTLDSSETSAGPEAGSAAHGPTSWPVDPFFKSGQDEETADADEQAHAAGCASAGYRLSAILAGAEPMAIIDGRVVGVGADLGEGTRVIVIEASSVTLQESNRTVILTLPE